MVNHITKDQIEAAVKEGKVITITTYAYRSEERNYIDSVLDMYLEEAGRQDLKNQLSYSLHELAGNAKKANTKRVYFLEKGLRIENQTEYCIGMKNFKEDTIENIHYFVRRLREYGYYIKFQFQKVSEGIKIAVRNNVPLLPLEEKRIKEKIIAARKYRNIAEAYAGIEDSSEGAGLGLVMMLLMLRGLGLGDRVLSIHKNRKETIALIRLPLQG